MILNNDDENTVRVSIKSIHKPSIPTGEEVRLILSYLPDYHPYKVALGFIIIQGLRPKEVANLTWDCFDQDDKGNYVWMRHLCYKPKNRRTYTGQNAKMYKEIEKPLYSIWLARQLAGYRERYGPYPYDKIFPFTTQDSLQKWLCKLRDKHPWLRDLTTRTPLGEPFNQYRISLYSFRRFAFTFHFYVTFEEDSPTLAEAFGHTRVETTMNHYVKYAESIGLQRGRKISIDQFIGLGDSKDLYIYMPTVTPLFPKVPGQRVLTNYFSKFQISNI